MNCIRFEFESLRKVPIPVVVLTSEGQAKSDGYWTVPVDETDPRSREELVDVRDFEIAGANHYAESYNPPYFHRIPGATSRLLVRRTVCDRLRNANRKLRDLGIELFLFDAYRPLAVQNHFFYHWMPQHLRELHPDRDPAWIEQESARYWAPGARTLAEASARPPPHSTGGAVDLGLRHIQTLRILEMGTLFDDVSERSHVDYYERSPSARALSLTDREAQANRRILFHAMVSEDFECHPREWWHYSYGDQRWAQARGARAIYGYAGVMFGDEFSENVSE
jgi:zinc D-Ala-D-Ala dipeptidase